MPEAGQRGTRKNMGKVQLCVCVSSSGSELHGVVYLCGSGRLGRAKCPPGVTGLMDESGSLKKRTQIHFKPPLVSLKHEETPLWRPERAVVTERKALNHQRPGRTAPSDTGSYQTTEKPTFVVLHLNPMLLFDELIFRPRPSWRPWRRATPTVNAASKRDVPRRKWFTSGSTQMKSI